jgi:hypothetical protein
MTVMEAKTRAKKTTAKGTAAPKSLTQLKINGLVQAGVDEESLRTKIINVLGLNPTTSLQAAVTMFFLRTADISLDYNKFIRHPDNRKINNNHVSTLVEILNEGGDQQIWYPVLVVKNYMGITANDPKGVVEDETAKPKRGAAKRVGTYVPEYILVDGQHRFEAFSKSGMEIVYCDLSTIYGDRVKDVNFVKGLVDKFNIGVRSYTMKEVRGKRRDVNDFLKNIYDEASKITNVRIHKDKNMRSEYIKHAQKGYETKNFAEIISNSWVEKALSDIAKPHVTTSFMSKDSLNKDQIKLIRKALHYSKCFIDGLDGHLPPMTTEAYSWVGYMTKNIHGSNVDPQYYEKLSKFLKDRMYVLNGGGSLRSKSDLKNASDMYRDHSVVREFLNTNYIIEVLTKPRTTSTGEQINGVYKILSIK